MNCITKDLILQDSEWTHVHIKLGCHGCKYAVKQKLARDACCCSHPAGILVNLDFKCIRKNNG